jgi:chorismate mutase
MSMEHESRGTGMADRLDNAAREREEIAARIAAFKATQEKFQREREEYFVTTLRNARLESTRHGFEPPPFWS